MTDQPAGLPPAPPPTPPPAPSGASPLLAHFWKGFALLVAGIAVWAGTELVHAQRTVGVHHTGVGPPPREESTLLRAFRYAGEQAEAATVTLKTGGQVRGYFTGADEGFVILSTAFPQTKTAETVLIPWENVAYLRRTDAKK
jgi:hypothetical protein